MNLLLHTPDSVSALSRYYRRAFEQAIELFIVTAYLTEWDASLELNSNCRRFRLIIGKDFGITRKAACEKVMCWLPPERKYQFMVADLIAGFHPKAVFWKELSGKCFAIVGSSNMTRAAFETNYEANVFSSISNNEYAAAKRWVINIEKHAVPVSEDWVRRYKEAAATGGRAVNKPGEKREVVQPLVVFSLPRPVGTENEIDTRRGQLAEFGKKRNGLISLFRRCANRQIKAEQFYDQLPHYWSNRIGDQLQGAGWARRGKGSDFQALSESFVRILDATEEDRDDIVAKEIDTLHQKHVETRKAFLSEMLCLQFPDEYPLLNQPIQDYVKNSVGFKAPKDASEGAFYIDLAKKLRFSLLQNPDHPAKTLAELDAIIWFASGK